MPSTWPVIGLTEHEICPIVRICNIRLYLPGKGMLGFLGFSDPGWNMFKFLGLGLLASGGPKRCSNEFTAIGLIN